MRCLGCGWFHTAAFVAGGRVSSPPVVHQGRAFFGSHDGYVYAVNLADGAQAWRCALQVNSPSARRLHWWVVPGDSGATIEFANVDVHDAYGIPD